MATVSFDVISKAFPQITNRIRATVSLPTSPNAAVATIIDSTAGHPERTWSFNGLPRNNYIFSLDEINSENVPISNLALFNIRPGSIEGSVSRDDEQITVDITPGLISGENEFVFDGTGDPAKPNYIGWEIVPSELEGGRGILIKGEDYTWDSQTATFKLIIENDIFQSGVTYNIHFNDKSSAVQSSPTITDFITKVIKDSSLLSVDDFGNHIIFEPNADYIEVTLPDIKTVPQGRKLRLEVFSDTLCCVKLVTNDVIKFARGYIYLMPNESLSIFRFNRDAFTDEWRVSEPFGNFISCGTIVSHDSVQASLFNVQLIDGTSGLTTKFARIYNEIVLNLPINQRCNFDEWGVGNNKYLYSLANSLNPVNRNRFHFPDRRNLYERANLNGKAGDYLENQNKEHWHNFAGDDSMINWNADPTLWIPEKADGMGSSRPGDLKNGDGLGHYIFKTSKSGGAEARPNSYLINKYILL